MTNGIRQGHAFQQSHVSIMQLGKKKSENETKTMQTEIANVNKV